MEDFHDLVACDVFGFQSKDQTELKNHKNSSHKSPFCKYDTNKSSNFKAHIKGFKSGKRLQEPPKKTITKD